MMEWGRKAVFFVAGRVIRSDRIMQIKRKSIVAKNEESFAGEIIIMRMRMRIRIIARIRMRI